MNDGWVGGGKWEENESRAGEHGAGAEGRLINSASIYHEGSKKKPDNRGRRIAARELQENRTDPPATEVGTVSGG